VNRKDYFENFEDFETPKKITVGNGDFLEALGSGLVRIVGHKGKETFLNDVYFTPDLPMNLVSVGKASEKGCSFSTKTNGECVFMKNNKPPVVGQLKDGFYQLQIKVKMSTSFVTANSLQEWHEKLVHQNKPHVKRTLKAHGISVDSKKDELCEPCVLGKHRRKSHKTSLLKLVSLSVLIFAVLWSCRRSQRKLSFWLSLSPILL